MRPGPTAAPTARLTDAPGCKGVLKVSSTQACTIESTSRATSEKTLGPPSCRHQLQFTLAPSLFIRRYGPWSEPITRSDQGRDCDHEKIGPQQLGFVDRGLG